MSWLQIARAYETGWTPPPSRRKNGDSWKPSRREITVDGETQSLKGWTTDDRNVHRVDGRTLSKRANQEKNLVSVEVFMRPPYHGGDGPSAGEPQCT